MTSSGHNNLTDTTATRPAACGQWAVVQAVATRVEAGNAEAHFTALRAQFPGRSARRMSRLGLMLGSLIRQAGIDEETTVLYGSAYGEGRTLEAYLASFPQASPLGFQSSIPPSGVEQVLILDQQPVRAFFPMVGSCEDLPLSLLRGLRLNGATQRTLLLGGEESCDWLKDSRLGANADFAFALLLEPATTANAATRLGTLTDHPAICAAHPIGCANTAEQQPNTGAPCNDGKNCDATDNIPLAPAINRPTLDCLCKALQARLPLHFSHPDEGTWTLNWDNAAVNAPQPQA